MAKTLFNERYPCPICERFHAIRECSHFLALPISARREKVMALKLCRNCLAQSHERPNCTSLDRCLICGSNHHSLVHPMILGHFWFPMTAGARIFNNMSRTWNGIRIMIDPTTKTSSMTLREAEVNACVIRHGYATIRLRHRRCDEPPIEVRCALVNRPFERTPKFHIDSDWASEHPIVQKNCCADPRWWSSQEYDVVLGADVGHKVFRGGGAIGKPGQTYLQHTVFGLAFFGEAKRRSC